MLDCKSQCCFDCIANRHVHALNPSHVAISACRDEIQVALAPLFVLVYDPLVPLSPTPISLTEAALPRLQVKKPTYDRANLRPAIVHIGVGGFHRAHLATYVQDLCEQGHRDWAIVGSGVMPGDHAMAEALEPQDCLYALIARDGESTDVTIIGSIVGYIHAHPDTDPLIQQIAEVTTQIVSLTVTEGGYPVDDVSRTYDPDSKVAGSESAFGIIAAGLELRRSRGHGPVTVLSCDNIMSNGEAARIATLGEAAKHSDELVEWIEASVTFPNSMVDRITPATSASDRSWLLAEHGIDDRWPVVAEPFRQWVLEDRFGGDRLPLEDLDVIVTNDVEPYEHMKLRLLNAGHSCLAYLAALDAKTTVDEAMSSPHIRSFVQAFLDDEAKPVVAPVAGIDLDVYVESLISRFSNPSIGDQISRLCLDGSAKFPKFLLPTVRAQLQANGPVALSALAVAGWCEYLNGTDRHGGVIELSSDPLLERAREHAAASKAEPASFLDFVEVFGTDLPESPRFVEAFTIALEHLRSGSVFSAIEFAMRDTD